MKAKVIALVMAAFLGYGFGAVAHEAPCHEEQCQCQDIDNMVAHFSPEDADALKEIAENYRQDAQQGVSADEAMQKLMQKLEVYFTQHAKVEEAQTQALTGIKTAALIAASAFAAWVIMKVGLNIFFASCAFAGHHENPAVEPASAKPEEKTSTPSKDTGTSTDEE